MTDKQIPGQSSAEAAAAGVSPTDQAKNTHLVGKIIDGRRKGGLRLRKLDPSEIERVRAKVPSVFIEDRGKKGGVWAYVAAVGTEPGGGPFMEDVTLSRGEPMSPGQSDEPFARRCRLAKKRGSTRPDPPVGPGSRSSNRIPKTR